jgi:hypothetical protein
MRLPVAAGIALIDAGANGGTPDSWMLLGSIAILRAAAAALRRSADSPRRRETPLTMRRKNVCPSAREYLRRTNRVEGNRKSK